MYLIDTHNHLGCDAFDEDRNQVLTRSIEQGVVRQIMIGVASMEWLPLLNYAQSHSSLFVACGIHPMYIPDSNELDFALTKLEQLLHKEKSNQKFCALGEIGLDYYYVNSNKEQQIKVFNHQLELAISFSRPILLHVRRAHADLIATLKRYRFKLKGIVHAFSGSYEEAKEYIKLGFKIGLGGVGTYPKAHKMHRVLKQLPLEAIVLETDAPDLPPISRQGQRNTPEYLPEICEQLARIKGITAEQLAFNSTQNACELFNWTLSELQSN